jgi:hypothetical protein
MTREDFLVWRSRLNEWARISALVDGARVVKMCFKISRR